MHEPEIRQFTASDGYRLHYRHWRPLADAELGCVVALHGIQSHSGWYAYSSRRLAEAGCEVCFLDRRGSGLNESDRGHAPHADRLVNDVAHLLADLRYRRGRARREGPLVLLGLSWGGKLAAAVAARRPELVDALALLYPGICARIGPRPDQRLRLRLAAGLGLQEKRVPIPLDDPALFTAERRWQEFIRDDPLTLHEASVGLLKASVDLDRQVAADVPERLGCPVLLMLAGRDRIVAGAAVKQWFQRVASTERTLVEYPEAQHTLEFEPNRERFVDDLLEWLQSLGPTKAA